MKIEFDDKSYVEVRLGRPGKIAIILSAADKSDKLKMQVNACELSIDQFSELINSLGIVSIKK
jgi:hypothetical protein